MNNSEKKAAILSIAFVLLFGLGCYRRDPVVIFLSFFLLAVIVIASYYVDKAEKRIRWYRRELSKMAREAIEYEPEEHHIAITKGKSA